MSYREFYCSSLSLQFHVCTLPTWSSPESFTELWEQSGHVGALVGNQWLPLSRILLTAGRVLLSTPLGRCFDTLSDCWWGPIKRQIKSFLLKKVIVTQPESGYRTLGHLQRSSMVLKNFGRILERDRVTKRNFRRMPFESLLIQTF